MGERYFQHTFANGLTLLAEQMPAVQSGAMTFLVPAGASTDPVDRSGSATVLSDLILRGAGSYLDNREVTTLMGISLRGKWVTVSYQTAKGRLEQAQQDLEYFYDYWVKMYLRRSNRASDGASALYLSGKNSPFGNTSGRSPKSARL